MCPRSCLSVPRSDGSCPVCICDGVALADCPSGEVECPADCSVERGPDGCRGCACPQGERVCPALPSCPQECQRRIDDNGCPECACDTPQRACPDVTCPEECTVEMGDDGCPSCRCDPPEVCPPIPVCLRGCIELDENGACFFCNCTLVDTDAFDSIGGDSIPPWPFTGTPFGFPFFDDNYPLVPELFGGRPFGSEPSDRRPVPGSGEVEGPSPRCRQEQRLRCPPGCRMAVAAHGCRECFCGDDAYLCPGVSSCASRCLFLNPEDRCCRCQCRRGPNIGGFPIGSFTPFRPRVPFTPNTIRRIFIRLPPLANPDRNLERNCSQEPPACAPDCTLIEDSDGCQLCVCPGDLCPRIRCPEHCIQGFDSNGCPICDCGGQFPLASPTDNPGNSEEVPDSEDGDPTAAEPVDPVAPVEPDAAAPTDSVAAATDADQTAAQTDPPPTTPPADVPELRGPAEPEA